MTDRSDSPLDVEGIDLNITTDEIVQFIREGRSMYSTGLDKANV
jgi:hypothetical protein